MRFFECGGCGWWARVCGWRVGARDGGAVGRRIMFAVPAVGCGWVGLVLVWVLGGGLCLSAGRPHGLVLFVVCWVCPVVVGFVRFPSPLAGLVVYLYLVLVLPGGEGRVCSVFLHLRSVGRMNRLCHRGIVSS